MAQSPSQESLSVTGQIGAQAASRYAGATASGAPTTGTFAVGDHIVDQSGSIWVCTVAGTPGTWQLSGVSVNENIAGKNFVINGGMDIWQRGTSFSVAAGVATYTADRWQTLPLGTNTITCSQVTANVKTTSTSSVTIGTGSLSFTISTGLVIAAGQGFEAYYTSGVLNAVYGTVTSYNSSTGVLVANITNTIGSGTYAAWTVTVATLSQFNYALRTQRNSGNTSGGLIFQAQSIETTNSIPMAGKTITLSFWARVGANFSGSTLNTTVNAGFGIDGNVLNGFTGSVTITSLSTSVTPTTSWQLFTLTGTVPAGATQLGYAMSYTPTGTAGANDYFDITGVQLEIAPQATPFSRAGGNYWGEYQLCLPYYEQYNNEFVGRIEQIDVANRPEFIVTYSQKRVNPTITVTNASNIVFNSLTANATANVTSFGGTYLGTQARSADLFFNTASGITAYGLYAPVTTAGSYAICISAEI